MENELKINSNNPDIDNNKGLVTAIMNYEKKVGIKLPNKCALKMLNYKDGDNVLALGFIHNLFIKRVNEKYEIFKDKKELKMSVVKMSNEENENMIAFWLQEIEYLEYKMKEVEVKNV